MVATRFLIKMQTEILKLNAESVEKAKNLLLSGEVVAIPTETVYGLGAIGLNPTAVKKIFEIKGRPSDNPLIAHVHEDYDLSKLVHIEKDYAKKLIKEFTPGPLTLVFYSKGVVCDEATCGGKTLAVRIPEHKGARQLLKAVNQPIVAPSANLSKHTSPVTATHVYNDLNGKVKLILDGGKCKGGIESTVLDCTGEVPRILRAGLITKEMIERVCGACEIAEHKDGDEVKSPGVKYTHYQPKCQTALFYESEIENAKSLYNEYLSQGKAPYIMCQTAFDKEFKGYNILSLGESEYDMANNLYDKLLEGETKADIIIAVAFERYDGVYLGVMNRLKKSCGRL